MEAAAPKLPAEQPLRQQWEQELQQATQSQGAGSDDDLLA